MPFTSNGDVRLYYEVVGEGPALLLHTGAGGDSRIWGYAGYLAALRGFRVLRMDQRGRGRSSRPNRVEDHYMEHFVADVAAVLRAAGVDRTHFWGYSAGLLVGLAFGSAHPDRLSTLVGTGVLPFRDYADEPPVPDPAAEIDRVVREGGVGRDVDAYMRKDNDRFPEEIDRNVREGDPRMYALDGLAWTQWRGPKSIYPTFRTPVLQLTGELEDPDGRTERSLGLLPNARGVRLPKVGHLAAFYRSDLALPHAVRFLLQHPP